MKFRQSLGLDYKDVLLVPKHSTVGSRHIVNIKNNITRNHTLDIPIMSANMDTITNSLVANAMNDAGGCGVLHRYNSIDTVCDWIKVLKANNVKPIIPSVGVCLDTQLPAAKRYIDCGADAICIDIAHGDSLQMLTFIEKLRALTNVPIIAGNIATVEGALNLMSAGAQTIKVGIGPGFVCTTRKQTGAGYPQLSAILEIADAVHARYGFVIADGGIREIGDCVKALAAGADAVMTGYLFRGSVESQCNGVYRGMASAEAQTDFKGEYKNVEGRATKVEYRGYIKDIMKEIEEGIQSGFSYCGAYNIRELRENSEFVIIK